jgi:hypothetical protein
MPENKSYSWNMELLAYHDLQGRPGFQMAMQIVEDRYYLYLAHFVHHGWTIMEVTDPENPRFVRFVEGPQLAGQFTGKIQVADGLMICSLGGQIPFLMGNKFSDPYIEGVHIYDVKDPEDPKFLSYWCSGESKKMGVHRFFYNGGRYAHLSSNADGFTNMIYRIIDVSDPTNPVEAGRWWLPEQWADGQMEETDKQVGELAGLDMAGMHGPAYVKGDYAYVSYGGAGMVILDISNIAVPRLVGQLKHMPPLSGGFGGARCHTIVPLSQRPYAIMTTEGERYPCFNQEIIKNVAQPMNIIGMVDVSDVSNPTLISIFPYPIVPEDYPYKNFNDCGIGCPGPFGPHNIHEPHDHPALEDRNDRVYCCYFHAGLRVYDISDPFVPREIAYYLPPNPTKWWFKNTYPGPMISTTEDVLVDNRGNIFIDTFHEGLYVLRCNL